jgi:uncharacterized membrane protein YecN with MAPEG domain
MLGIFLVLISARVSLLRSKFKVMFGDGGHDDLMRAVRAQANFVEYVPLALLLIAFVEWGGLASWAVHTLAGVLLASRVIHSWGITSRKDPARGVGATLTWLVLLVAGSVALYQHF